jgi:hypothetical protein
MKKTITIQIRNIEKTDIEIDEYIESLGADGFELESIVSTAMYPNYELIVILIFHKSTVMYEYARRAESVCNRMYNQLEYTVQAHDNYRLINGGESESILYSMKEAKNKLNAAVIALRETLDDPDFFKDKLGI